MVEGARLENDSGELIERYRNISSRNRFNDFPPQNASRCEPVNVGICQSFRGHLTQFLHNFERHFCAYCVVCLGVCRESDWPGR